MNESSLRNLLSAASLLLFLCLALTGCSAGTVDDAGCQFDADCPGGQCVEGLCTTFCENDLDCPVGYLCTNRVCQAFGDGTPDPAPEATPDPAPEATPDPAPEATPDPAPEATPDPAPEATPDPEPEATPDPEPEPDCLADADCADSQHCLGGACVDGCHNDGGCLVGQVCDLQSHTCVASPSSCGGETCLDAQWCDHFALECVSELPGQVCALDDDCPEGQECSPSNDADDLLVLVCRPDQGAGEDVCDENTECRSGFCANGSCFAACAEDGDCALEGARCSAVSVTPDEGFDYTLSTCRSVVPCGRDADCAQSEVCTLVPVGEGLEAMCVQAQGASPSGTPCQEDAECASGACFGDSIRRCLGVCTEDVDCQPSNNACLAVSFLLDDGGTPDDPLDDATVEHNVCDWSEGSGSACASNSQCRDEICALEIEDDLFITECRPAWGSAGAGEACQNSNDCQAGLCLVGDICHGACETSADCLGGTVCQEVPVSEEEGAQTIRFCVEPPEVCASDLDCAQGLSCLPVSDPNTPNQVVGACVSAPNLGGLLAGQSCTADAQCASDFCMSQFGTEARVCYGICELGTDNGCNDGTVCYPNRVYLTFDQGTIPANDDRYDSTAACSADVGSMALCANDAGCAAGEICYPTSNRFWNAFELRCLDAFNPGGLGRGASCSADSQCASDFCVEGGFSNFCFTICANSSDCAGILLCQPAELTVNDRGTQSTLDDIADSVNVCQ